MVEQNIVDPILKHQLADNAYSLLIGSGWSKDLVLSYLKKYVYAELPLIVVENIHKSFHRRPLLKGVSLEVMKGDIFGIIGPSGCGKSTLLKLLVSYLAPDRGRVAIKVRGKKTYKNLNKCPTLLKTTFGFSTQNPSFYPQLTPLQNLLHFCSLYGYSQKESLKRAQELIEFANLSDLKNVPSGELSRGLQKKLDIACAIIHDPEILVLDEPTADLDPVSRKHILDLIKELQSKGKTIILASHFLEDLERLCTKIALLDNGRISFRASPAEFTKLYASKMQVWVKTNSQDYNRLHLLFRKSYEQGGWFTFLTNDVKRDLAKMSQKLNVYRDFVVGFKYVRPSLTEIFGNLVHQNGEYHQAY